MKLSKRLESLTKKGEFSPHTLLISGCSPLRGVGCLLALAVRYNPLTGFCHKPYEVTVEPQSRDPHLLCTGHVIHSQKHTVKSVKYSRKCVCQKNKELELQRSLSCPEESQTSTQDERLMLNHETHWDSWPLEENNSIFGLFIASVYKHK